MPKHKLDSYIDELMEILNNDINVKEHIKIKNFIINIKQNSNKEKVFTENQNYIKLCAIIYGFQVANKKSKIEEEIKKVLNNINIEKIEEIYKKLLESEKKFETKKDEIASITNIRNHRKKNTLSEDYKDEYKKIESFYEILIYDFI
jgi:hypothetical protein